MAYFIYFGLPLILLIIGFPIFLILLVTSIIAVLTVTDIPTEAIQTYMFGSLDNFPLLAVPFFVLAGEIMAQGGDRAAHHIHGHGHRRRRARFARGNDCCGVRVVWGDVAHR